MVFKISEPAPTDEEGEVGLIQGVMLYPIPGDDASLGPWCSFPLTLAQAAFSQTVKDLQAALNDFNSP